MRYDYSRQRLGAMTLRLLAHLAAERGFAEWREALLAGERDQLDREARRLAHGPAGGRRRAARGQGRRWPHEGSVCGKLRSEKQFKRIVNLGTGGSDLGPRLLADALGDGTLDVRFAANVDPHDLERALEGAEPASTLFVVVSKTFTTQETMANAAAAKAVGRQGTSIAVTANVEAAKRVRRERDPADVGLGRRALLGVVGGRLRRRLRHRLRCASRNSCQAAARSTSTSPKRRSRRTCRR